jgi:hypothetical protein
VSGAGYRRVTLDSRTEGPTSSHMGRAPWFRLVYLPCAPVRISVGRAQFRGSLLWIRMPSGLHERLFALLFGRARSWSGEAWTRP